MRNKISCSAKKLSQLEPNMVQSVVGGHVFKLGNQYLSENRVRILESGVEHISAEVDGTYGVYSQSIRLKAGTLTTKCSCPASEQPFCRHCVAVLLEYSKSQVVETPELPKEITQNDSNDSKGSVEEMKQSSSPTGFNFHEVTLFIDWVQSTVVALKQNSPLPSLSDLGAGEVRHWAEAIHNLRGRFQQSEEDRGRAESELEKCRNRIGTLTQDLDQSTQAAKELKVKCDDLRQELVSCQDMLEQHAEVVKERDRYIDQLNGMRGELLRKGAELDTLAASLKQVSAALQAITPSPR